MLDLVGGRPEDAVVFGDGLNDISMFRKPFFSIAMGNGRDELKARADYVTGDNDKGGILEACKKFGFRCLPLLAAFLLDAQRIFNGADQIFVDLFDRFDVDDGPFIFNSRIVGVLLEHGRIALEELIRRIGNGLLHLQGFFLPSPAGWCCKWHSGCGRRGSCHCSG